MKNILFSLALALSLGVVAHKQLLLKVAPRLK